MWERDAPHGKKEDSGGGEDELEGMSSTLMMIISFSSIEREGEGDGGEEEGF